MQRKSFGQMPCPIARSLERVGEWWSMLIMRDVLHGITRFDALQGRLGIAPNMLARRLNALVGAGMVERRRYSAHPPRYEYLPTARGRDFRPVLISLMAFGNRHFAPEGPSVILINRRTGAVVDPILADPATGRRLDEPDYGLVPGPAARSAAGAEHAAAAQAPSSRRQRASAVRKQNTKAKPGAQARST
jgi:DNA-binding HxlR family transcriptional regulator